MYELYILIITITNKPSVAKMNQRGLHSDDNDDDDGGVHIVLDQQTCVVYIVMMMMMMMMTEVSTLY